MREPHHEPPPSRFAESFRFGFLFGLAFHMTPFLIFWLWPKVWLVLQPAVLCSGGMFCVIMKLSQAQRVAAGATASFVLCLTLYLLVAAVLLLGGT